MSINLIICKNAIFGPTNPGHPYYRGPELVLLISCVNVSRNKYTAIQMIMLLRITYMYSRLKNKKNNNSFKICHAPRINFLKRNDPKESRSKFDIGCRFPKHRSHCQIHARGQICIPEPVQRVHMNTALDYEK